MADTHPSISKGNSNFPSGYFTGSSPSYVGAELSAEENEQSVDDSGPSTPTHDLDSLDDNDVIINVKPYAVEEPEDESESDMPGLDLPRLPDRFERWQRDLSDYMNDLNYQADGQHSASVSTIRKRGHKRKSVDAAALRQHCYLPFEQNVQKPSSGTRHQAHGQWAKRQRCNMMSREQSYSTGSFDAFREANGNESSSSETRSTDCSGIDTLNNSPMADEMDID